MRRICICISVLLLCLGARAQEQLPTWKEGWLDIHTLATGKGDANFLILPDGTTWLIDAGDMTGVPLWEVSHPLPYDGRTPGQWIAKYILDHSQGLPHPQTVDYFLLTHFHADHLGNALALKPGPHYGLCGIMEVGEQIHFGKIVDRGWPGYDFPSRKAVQRHCKTSVDEYIKFVHWQAEHNGSVAEQFAIGSTKQFTLKHNPKKYKDLFRVWNIAANARVTTGKGLKSRPLYTKEEDPEQFDENMFSTVFRLDYGPFSYYNGGDLPGNNWPTTAKFNRDYESVIADIVGPVTAMKADHHGTRDSSNPYFLWKTRPDVIVIPASETKHPWKDTFDRYKDPQGKGKRQLFVTGDAGRKLLGEERWAQFPPAGHVVIRVYEGGTSYQVFVLDAGSGDYRILYRSEIYQL
ncbi:MAG: hypothetical protein IJV01_06100 [Bacteroidales bacterium]|nr:hypothetical protein [Bacteroidales bacterium]